MADTPLESTAASDALSETNTMSDPAISKLTYEQALEELRKIVARLESGEIPLEDAVTAYERGVALKQHCETRLRGAQMRIEKIRLGDSDEAEIASEPFGEE